MERIKSLVDKLNGQLAQNAALDQLLTTVQLLQNEIMGSMKEINVLGAKGVSVIVPRVPSLSKGFIESGNSAMNINNDEKEYFELILENVNDDGQEIIPLDETIPKYEEIILLQKPGKEIKEKDNVQASLTFAEDASALTEELPTLSRQTKYPAKSRQSAAPKASKYAIKDLKKAINEQDKLIFVRELFRGDDAMFERSVKTINGFSILAEAEYWIKRELKTLNGWLPDNPITQKFEQLVKRRFA